MCAQVRLDGFLCSTPRELAARLGGEKYLEWVDCHGEMNWCLCVIDVPRTLERSVLTSAREGASKMFVVER